MLGPINMNLRYTLFLFLSCTGFYEIAGFQTTYSFGHEWFEAAKNGELTKLQLLINIMDINDRDLDGETALTIAAWAGHAHIVRFLLQQAPININAQNSLGFTSLMNAVFWGNEEIVELLLQAPDIDINAHDIHGENAYTLSYQYPAIKKLICAKIHEQWLNAARNGNLKLMQSLIDKVDINIQDDNGNTALIEAAYKEHESIVKFLLSQPSLHVNAQNKAGETALITAMPNENIVKLLLKVINIDINIQAIDGESGLIFACREGYEKIVKLLLELPQLKLNLKNKHGNTALISAASKGHNNIVNMLLSARGIDINAQNKIGETALSKAATSGHVFVIKNLIEVPHLNINAQTNAGITPLIAAASWGHEQIVKLLLSTPGIDVNIQDNDGDTALRIAIGCLEDKNKNNYQQIITALAQHPEININAVHGPNKTTVLMEAAKQDHEDIVKLLLEIPGINIAARDFYGCTVLQFPEVPENIKTLIWNKTNEIAEKALKAITDNDRETLNAAIAKIGIDSIFDSSGPTILDCAFQEKRPQMIEFLLQNAEDPQKLLERFPFAYIDPASDLFRYFLNLAYGKESFRPDIFKAIKNNNIEQLRDAISQMASVSTKLDLNFTDAQGDTPLHKAIKKNSLPMIYVILNADPEILFDLINKNPIELATGNLDILNLFMDLAYPDHKTTKSKKRKHGDAQFNALCANCIRLRPHFAHQAINGLKGYVGQADIQSEYDLHAKVCANCGEPNCIKRCSACRDVYYCSSKCQKAHWKKHKQDCRLDSTKKAKNS